MWSSANLTTSTPHGTLSRLYHAACTLSVYASQPGSPPDHAHTRFRLVASLDRSGLSPAGSHRWFPVMSVRLHGVLHHQASPGAINQ